MSLNILDILIVIFNPSYWIMNDSYNKEWDKKLNELMKEHKFIREGYSSKLGDYSMWTENHPYASFIPQSYRMTMPNWQITPTGVGRGRPSRVTIIRARRKWKMDILPIEDKRDILLKRLGL